jgi:hypothetical protein
MSDETEKEAINEESETIEATEYMVEANRLFNAILKAAQPKLDKHIDKLSNSIGEAYWDFFKQTTKTVCIAAMKIDSESKFTPVMVAGAEQWSDMVCKKISEVVLKEVQKTMREELVNGLDELKNGKNPDEVAH